FHSLRSPLFAALRIYRVPASKASLCSYLSPLISSETFYLELSNNKSKKVMSTSSSVFSTFFTSRRKDLSNIKLNLASHMKLEGQKNYVTWSSAIIWTLKTYKGFEVTVEGLKPAESKDDAPLEWETYESLVLHGVTILIDTVNSDIQTRLVKMSTSYEMWTYLRAEYYCNTSYDF